METFFILQMYSFFCFFATFFFLHHKIILNIIIRWCRFLIQLLSENKKPTTIFIYFETDKITLHNLNQMFFFSFNTYLFIS